jgi:vesicular inhibitory amino acid transporter
MILEKKYSLFKSAREPFPLIAYEAGGNFARYLVYVTSYVQLVGVAVIFLLIASHNFATVLNQFVFHFCDYTILITIIMCPIAMFGTPKDFWVIAVGAMICTGIACLLLFIQTLRQIPDVLPDPSPVTFK